MATVQGKLAAPTSRTESLILWRRIAGGCSPGQQKAIADPLLAAVRTLHKKQMTGKGSDPTFSPHEGLEVLRLLGSLELLPAKRRLNLAISSSICSSNESLVTSAAARLGVGAHCVFPFMGH
jgi:hypothetical protein